MNKQIYATWCISDNLGDKLNVWLIKKITGLAPIYCTPADYYEKYLCIGSILNWATKDCIVWGAGIANKDDEIKETTICSTRGPLSRERYQVCTNICSPELYGDPALVVPKFYYPTLEVEYDIGIIPHYVDQAIIHNTQQFKKPNIKIINVFDSIETIVDDICSCKVILASSLHGLILAHAYGKKASWFKASSLISGDDTKFYDYFLSQELTKEEPLKLYKFVDDDLTVLPGSQPAIDIEKIYNTCPFK